MARKNKQMVPQYPEAHKWAGGAKNLRVIEITSNKSIVGNFLRLKLLMPKQLSAIYAIMNF